jgi:hypothetical protein
MRDQDPATMNYVRYISGFFYVLSGLAKVFPNIEDIPQTLREAALNNAGTILEPAGGLPTMVV